MAETLLGANRLYRQSASMAGDAATAALLEDVERALLEIAHAPEDGRATDVERLRQRVSDQKLLFRMRVAGAQMNLKRVEY